MVPPYQGHSAHKVHKLVIRPNTCMIEVAEPVIQCGVDSLYVCPYSVGDTKCAQREIGPEYSTLFQDDEKRICMKHSSGNAAQKLRDKFAQEQDL